MDRRNFLRAAATAAALSSSSQGASERLPIKKAVLLGMLPDELSYKDRVQLARDVGFEELECPTILDTAEAEEILGAARAAGATRRRASR